MGVEEERAEWLKLLAEDDDDEENRVIYADWLEEHGEPEEAERQRKYLASKCWLQEFCENRHEADCTDGYGWCDHIGYGDLIKLCAKALASPLDEDGDPVTGSLFAGSDMDIGDAIHHEPAFWKHAAIVTGFPAPEGAFHVSFRCSC